MAEEDALTVEKFAEGDTRGVKTAAERAKLAVPVGVSWSEREDGGVRGVREGETGLVLGRPVSVGEVGTMVEGDGA